MPLSLHTPVAAGPDDGQSPVDRAQVARSAVALLRSVGALRRGGWAAAGLVLGSALSGCGPAAGAVSAGSPAASPVASATTGAPAPGDSVSARLDRARILGDSTARVWLIMVSDFQCPYCKQLHDASFSALQREYVATGKVRMAFVNYPLPMHQNAWPAAEAAMCAGAQGRFWPMHDALFVGQSAWAEQRAPAVALDSLAHTVGVDTAAFHRCIASHSARPLIQADVDRSERAGVSSTPTVIIGSRLLVGVQPTENYRHALDSALAVAK